MDVAVGRVLHAVAEGDVEGLRLALHPYLHWTEAGRTIRGRSRVLAHLADHPVTGEPEAFEVRDHQIYRWTAR